MPAFALAVPVLPGKSEQVRAFARQIYGDRLGEFRSHQRALGVTRESWHLQSTSNEHLLVLYFEAGDLGFVFREFGASTMAFDLWFKQQMLEVTGVDFSHPPSEPPSECLGEVGNN